MKTKLLFAIVLIHFAWWWYSPRFWRYWDELGEELHEVGDALGQLRE